MSRSAIYCQCADPGCKACKGQHGRDIAGTRGYVKATSTLYRVDMQDFYGTGFCTACANDALLVAPDCYSDSPS